MTHVSWSQITFVSINVMIPPFQSQYSHCICYTCAPLASLLGQALPQTLRFSFGNRLKSNYWKEPQLVQWPNHPNQHMAFMGTYWKYWWKSPCRYIKSKTSQPPHQPETPIQPRNGRRSIKWIILRWCLALEVFHGMTWEYIDINLPIFTAWYIYRCTELIS